MQATNQYTLGETTVEQDASLKDDSAPLPKQPNPHMVDPSDWHIKTINEILSFELRYGGMFISPPTLHVSGQGR